jgi:hypothetical protein
MRPLNAIESRTASELEMMSAAAQEDVDVARSGTSVTGARNDPEQALANLLTVLDGLGIITDNTTAT